jgi:uncharacterized membrane protein
MIDTLIVGIIVLAAAVYVGRRLYRQFSSRSAACGCNGCASSASCKAAGAGGKPSPGCGHL